MNRAVRISKTLAFWLRHDPAAGGICLDERGWVDVEDVLGALGRVLRPPVSLDELERVVAGNDKQRFTIRDGRIRASQGHSIGVQVEFRRVEPPPALYHGTTRERWARIKRGGGLSKMRRHHVHLSPDVETARRVAARHGGGEPVILRVDAASARARGHEFLLSENGVYLIDAVPLEYLSELERGGEDDEDR